MQSLALDPGECAKAANLVYVTDAQPGIRRVKKGKGFSYLFDGKKITGPEELLRIRMLVIPPAWKNVWICKTPDGHLQVTGFDARGRKQYRYHPHWNELRNHTKFSRLLLFGEKLPVIRAQVEKDMARRELCEVKVLATIVSLMESTCIRIGNSSYEKANGSYGLTTLKDQHVKIAGDNVRFRFKGKKGVVHTVTISSRRQARIIRQCKEIPGKELFRYYDAEGNVHAVDSGQVNAYIKAITGEDFTAKDFRTWAGTLNALQAFGKSGEAGTVAAKKQKILEMLDYVSSRLGNTRAVCKKYYIHPVLLDLYEKQELSAYLGGEEKQDEKNPGRIAEELVLLRILRAEAK